ncbi:hypothetical protein RRF57_010894 [Xylaria bambusicola]|uniref:Protein kinase domain-containing protein n=1 Tax=Xylaria bambusicola TaxID=326684 RepID=A0AAN7Z9S9_9PEZI
MTTKPRLHEFRARLAASMRRSAWTSAYQRYIPSSDIERCTSEEWLREIIQEDRSIEQKEEFLDYVLREARILFAMFAYYKLPIGLLQSVGYTDDKLPIPITDSPPTIEREEIHIDFVELINVGQWMFLAPKFSSTGSHQELNPNKILPFRSMEQVGAGTFGTVYKVEIEPSHLNNVSTRKDI